MIFLLHTLVQMISSICIYHRFWSILKSYHILNLFLPVNVPAVICTFLCRRFISSHLRRMFFFTISSPLHPILFWEDIFTAPVTFPDGILARWSYLIRFVQQRPANTPFPHLAIRPRPTAEPCTMSKPLFFHSNFWRPTGEKTFYFYHLAAVFTIGIQTF